MAPAQAYSIRTATIADIPHIVSHRELMFTDMGIPAAFEEMRSATERWLRDALPSNTYRGWLVVAPDGAIAAGGGLIVIPWPPGPMSMDPRCGFIFNVYTAPAHRKRGLARLLMDEMHAWSRAAGLERVVLNASASGRPIYEAMGYVATTEPMMRMRL
ncbi:MAG: GNAT family N-acetyltransferase [Acidimicrobiia bacterium]